jgi:hypothetical protein
MVGHQSAKWGIRTPRVTNLWRYGVDVHTTGICINATNVFVYANQAYAYARYEEMKSVINEQECTRQLTLPQAQHLDTCMQPCDANKPSQLQTQNWHLHEVNVCLHGACCSQ